MPMLADAHIWSLGYLWFLVQIIALRVLARAEGNISSVGQERDIASLTHIFWLVFSIFAHLPGFYWDSLQQYPGYQRFFSRVRRGASSAAGGGHFFIT